MGIDIKGAIDHLFGQWELKDLKFADFVVGAGVFISILGNTFDASSAVTRYIENVMDESKGEILNKFIPCAEGICIEEDLFKYCISFDSPKKARVLAVRNLFRDTYVITLQTQGSKPCIEPKR